VELRKVDEESSLSVPCGHMRYWVDMVPSDEQYNDYDVGSAAVMGDFELRITIWGIDMINIFRDAGMRNDMVVKGSLLIRDIKGDLIKLDRETDCHKMAHDVARFNYRWKFDVQCPIASASLVIRLEDEDLISDHDAIYDPKVIPLDHHLRLTYRNWKLNPEKILGAAHMQIVFDAWPRDSTARYVSCWPCLSHNIPASPCIMTMDVQCVPKKYADANPVGAERDGPKPLPAPADRVDLNTALSDPLKLVKTVLGPENYVLMLWLLAFTTVTVILFAITAILFYIKGSFYDFLPERPIIAPWGCGWKFWQYRTVYCANGKGGSTGSKTEDKYPWPDNWGGWRRLSDEAVADGVPAVSVVDRDGSGNLRGATDYLVQDSNRRQLQDEYPAEQMDIPTQVFNVLHSVLTVVAANVFK